MQRQATQSVRRQHQRVEWNDGTRAVAADYYQPCPQFSPTTRVVTSLIMMTTFWTLHALTQQNIQSLPGRGWQSTASTVVPPVPGNESKYLAIAAFPATFSPFQIRDALSKYSFDSACNAVMTSQSHIWQHCCSTSLLLLPTPRYASNVAYSLFAIMMNGFRLANYMLMKWNQITQYDADISRHQTCC